MPKTTAIESDITNGPSKFELMLSLMDRMPNPHRIGFTLSGDNGLGVSAIITGLSIENGSGESWNFKATVMNLRRRHEGRNPPRADLMEGTYHTDTRKGWARITFA